MNKDWKIETLAVQGGYEPKSGEARIVPIVQSTTFKYDNAAQVTRLFDLEEAGFFYTRLANPTSDAFEQKIAQMEGGVGALATSAGQAATTLSIFNICQASTLSPPAPSTAAPITCSPVPCPRWGLR
jgi:O-acetylhomoserine (thiol)-lyase